MKFAIPFLKKRTVDKEPLADEPSPSSAGRVPSALPEVINQMESKGLIRKAGDAPAAAKKALAKKK